MHQCFTALCPVGSCKGSTLECPEHSLRHPCRYGNGPFDHEAGKVKISLGGNECCFEEVERPKTADEWRDKHGIAVGARIVFKKGEGEDSEEFVIKQLNTEKGSMKRNANWGTHPSGEKPKKVTLAVKTRDPAFLKRHMSTKKNIDSLTPNALKGAKGKKILQGKLEEWDLTTLCFVLFSPAHRLVEADSPLGERLVQARQLRNVKFGHATSCSMPAAVLEQVTEDLRAG